MVNDKNNDKNNANSESDNSKQNRLITIKENPEKWLSKTING